MSGRSIMLTLLHRNMYLYTGDDAGGREVQREVEDGWQVPPPRFQPCLRWRQRRQGEHPNHQEHKQPGRLPSQGLKSTMD